jgi:hypothetical protein
MMTSGMIELLLDYLTTGAGAERWRKATFAAWKGWVEDLTAEQKQELAALQAVYDSALASDRAMERLLEDIRRCSDTKVRETLILWLDRQIDEAKLPVKH